MDKPYLVVLVAALGLPLQAAIMTSATAGANSQSDGIFSSASTNFSDLNYAYSGTANISAGYFTLSGSTQSTISGQAPCPGVGSCPAGQQLPTNVTANISDSLTILTPDGAPGILQIDYAFGLSGTMENTGGSLQFLKRTYTTPVTNATDSQTIAFQSGVPIPLNLALSYGGTALPGAAPLGFASQSTSETFTLGKIIALDANGNVLPSYYFVTTTGNRYALVNGTYVPEPASWMAVAFGLVGVYTLRECLLRRRLSRVSRGSRI